MDIQHLKYAVEVERCRSISKAAEKLFVSQPFLSKAIRELEQDAGLDIFNRTSRGVLPTKKGEAFLAHAKEIIASMEELENEFRPHRTDAYHFEFAVPIACYISQAFVEFMKEVDKNAGIRADYRETNTMSAIAHVADHDCNLGIIRYPTAYEDYFLRYVESKDLLLQPIWEFSFHLVMAKNSPLASKEEITEADLETLIEITHDDPEVPQISPAEMQALRRRTPETREIVVYERQSQFELLCAMPETYMWASPTPQSVMDTYPLTERRCDLPDNRYKDALIYRRGYHLTGGDCLFIEKVNKVVRELSER
ncbi:MAG: LysR family transcriptional regulator [Ruminococcaceae bacterium]|nr:LysR family transcriptional regulator [Oscillospiraceae bacterium]